MVSVEDERERFKRERDAALLSLDEAKIRRFARNWGVRWAGMHRESFWRAVHKARTSIRSLPMEARRESKKWLIERGSRPFDDGEIPED